MAYSVRIKNIYLRNFIGIQTGLGKKEIEVNFKKLRDKNIILILGDNATGKSTFMSVLHCLPGTTDGRNKFIIEGKEGIKKIKYERSDGCDFECKIIYSPSKTGHNTKGFVTKITQDGEEIELNENGNITSYKEVVLEELGISDAILKLANQNDVCKGHVDMTATERKVNMSTFLPDDIYSGYYAIVDKTYKELKTRINILVESIGKMHDEDVLKLELERVTNKINDLVKKRDKCTSKISEYTTRIDVIREGGIEDRAKKLNREIRDFYDDIQKIQRRIEDIFSNFNLGSLITRDATLVKIQTVLTEVTESAKNSEIEAKMLIGRIADSRIRRNSISEQIASKKNSIADLETSHTLGELRDLRQIYKNRAKEFEHQLSKVQTDVTKDTFMAGYSIVANVRRYIDSFGYYDRDLVEAVCQDHYRDFRVDELSIKKKSLNDERETILAKIASLDADDEKDSILDRRPENCTIDSCPFIANAYKLKKIQDKMPEYTSRLDEIDHEIAKIDEKLQRASDMEDIKEKLRGLINYIESCRPVIEKLPYSSKYSTPEAIKIAIIRGGNNLSDCDNFDEFIEVLELREEYDELINKTIPQVEHEIELLETKGMFIDSTKKDLERLTSEKDEIEASIFEDESKLDAVNDTIEYYKGIINALSNFHDKKIEYDNLYDQIMANDAELKSISSQLEEIAEYRERIAEKQDRLNEIENELNPLTRERELYRMEQLKIADNKQELAAVECDMYNCEVIRAALSVKDNGIPVGALEFFMDTVRQTANALLSKAFNGNLYLEEFIINTKEFTIPYKKNGDRGMDVSFSSSSERSFISLCLTLAIIEEIVNSYTIVCLDEVDRGFALAAKSKFIEILTTQIRRSGIEQLFLVTHNSQFYQGYDNIGYIMFPGSDVSADEEDIIHIERS